MPSVQDNDGPEDAFGADPKTHAVLRRRAAAMGRSLKFYLRVWLGALRDITDGPTSEESWRMANGETWEQIQHPHDNDDV